MGEIRQNRLDGQWIIYAPRRGERPRDYRRQERNPSALPEFDADCPFCPGNEDKIPGILFEKPASRPDHWQTRAIPNKFPALTPVKNNERRREGIHIAMPGYGCHEVIIETPKHNQHPAQMTAREMEAAIETYHQRFTEAGRDHANKTAILFRNHGLQAGTSLVHPHSQLVVTGFVPPHIRWREAEAQRYFDKWGRCVLCDMLSYEEEDDQRVIFENDTFITFVPFAAEVPFELWIVPRRHQSSFGSIIEEQIADLGTALQDALSRLYKGLDDPDYNFVFHSSAQFRSDAPHWHWYLQVRPRLTTQAGFEIGSGVRINPSLPEEDAGFLREAAGETWKVA